MSDTEIEHDTEARAIYISFSGHNGKVARTKALSDSINVDYDTKGLIVGVEVLY